MVCIEAVIGPTGYYFDNFEKQTVINLYIVKKKYV
jgi:hypothetical protein